MTSPRCQSRALSLVELVITIAVLGILSAVAVPTIGKVVEGSRRGVAENVVQSHVWVSQDQLSSVRYKPDALGRVAFGQDAGITYDPLERVVL